MKYSLKKVMEIKKVRDSAALSFLGEPGLGLHMLGLQWLVRAGTSTGPQRINPRPN